MGCRHDEGERGKEQTSMTKIRLGVIGADDVLASVAGDRIRFISSGITQPAIRCIA